MTEPRKPAARELLRFGLYAAPLVIIGIVGNAVLSHFGEKDRVIAEQKRVIAELGRKLDRAWADELVADLRVDRLEKGPDGVQQMHLTFIQYEPGGKEKPAMKKKLVLPGEEVYVDALVVQFDRELVEEGDGLKGKSILLFRRAFGDRQQPAEGVPLFRTDEESIVPQLVQVDARPSELEQRIWARFWDYANDPKRAAAEGVRVAQGEAPHVKVVAGQVYQLRLRAAGGLEMKPRLPDAVVGE